MILTTAFFVFLWFTVAVNSVQYPIPTPSSPANAQYSPSSYLPNQFQSFSSAPTFPQPSNYFSQSPYQQPLSPHASTNSLYYNNPYGSASFPQGYVPMSPQYPSSAAISYPIAGSPPGFSASPYSGYHLPPGTSHPRGHQLPTLQEFHARRTPPFYMGMPYYQHKTQQTTTQKPRESYNQRPREIYSQRPRESYYQPPTQKPAVKHSGEVYSFSFYNDDSRESRQTTPKSQVTEAPTTTQKSYIIQAPTTTPKPAKIEQQEVLKIKEDLASVPIVNETEVNVKEMTIKTVIANQNSSLGEEMNQVNHPRHNEVIPVSEENNEQKVPMSSENASYDGQQNNSEGSKQDLNQQTNLEGSTHDLNQQIQNVIQDSQGPHHTQTPIIKAFHVRHRTEIPTPEYPKVDPNVEKLYNPFMFAAARPEDVTLQQAFFPQITARIQAIPLVPSPIPIVTQGEIPVHQNEPETGREITHNYYDDGSQSKKNREDDDEGNLYFFDSPQEYQEFDHTSRDRDDEDEEAESGEEY